MDVGRLDAKLDHSFEKLHPCCLLRKLKLKLKLKLKAGASMVEVLAHLTSTYADIMLCARDNGNGLRGSHVVIGGTPASTSTGGSLYGTVEHYQLEHADGDWLAGHAAAAAKGRQLRATPCSCACARDGSRVLRCARARVRHACMCLPFVCAWHVAWLACLFVCTVRQARSSRLGVWGHARHLLL